MIKKEKRAKLLLDHHKDTFQLILYNIKIRNRLFIYGLLILSIIIFDACSPNSLTELFNFYMNKNFQGQINLNFSIFISFIWFLLLCMVIEYFKRSIHIDRQFRYLGKVEEDINTAMAGDFVTREGRAYDSRTGVPNKKGEKARPFCLRAIGPLYTYVFPLVLIFVIIFRTLDTFSLKKGTAIFNEVIGIGIIFYSISYLLWIKSDKRKR